MTTALTVAPEQILENWCEGHQEPHECWLCHDGGRLRKERDLDDPLFGKSEICICRKLNHLPGASLTPHELGLLRVPKRLQGVRLRDWRSPVGGSARPRIVAEAYCRTFPELKAKHLFLTGPAGTGKTLIACAILETVFDVHQVRGEFWTVSDMLDRFRDSFGVEDDDGRETTAEVRDHFRKVPLLVLDEIGVGDQTEWAQSQLFALVDYRYNEQLPLIVTSNVDLLRLPYRVASRLNEPSQCTRVTFAGRDQRPGTEPGLVLPFTPPVDQVTL